MQNELWTTVTMRLVAAGHTLAEARGLAAMVLVQLLMLCVLHGHRTERPEESRPSYPVVPERACSCSFPDAGGSSLAGTGAAVRCSRAFVRYS